MYQRPSGFRNYKLSSKYPEYQLSVEWFLQQVYHCQIRMVQKARSKKPYDMPKVNSLNWTSNITSRKSVNSDTTLITLRERPKVQCI